MKEKNILKGNSKQNEMLERLELLKKSLANKGEICIIGHDNIDVDAVLSGILLSKLLNFLNIKSKFIILEPIKIDDTFDIVRKLTNIDMYSFEENEEKYRNLFLVDHYEKTHIGRVLGCIDHHPTEKKNNYIFSYVRNASSTAYMIYELMKAANYPINEKEAQMIVVSMMVDTTSFRNTKATQAEIEVAKSLSEEFNLDYNYLEKTCLCLTPIETMTISQITSNGQKKYNYNGHNVTSSYLQLYGMQKESVIESWIRHLSSSVGINKFSPNMCVFIIFDVESNMTYEYQIKKTYTKKITHKGILSRGKDIMPKIEKSFSNTYSRDLKLEIIIKMLSTSGYTLATMESCTGGGLASAITNISGASDILHESYVTYCNDAKIKYGVQKEIIDTYTVYSPNTAIAMANAVKITSKADVGIGITGQLGRVDPNNLGVTNNKAWYAISCPKKQTCVEIILNNINSFSREEKKEIIIEEIIDDLFNV